MAAIQTTCRNGHMVLVPATWTSCPICGALLNATRGQVPIVDLRELPPRAR